jgi:hypothetical protein
MDNLQERKTAKQLEVEIDNLEESNDNTNGTNNTNRTKTSPRDTRNQDKKYFFELKNYCRVWESNVDNN